VAKIKKLIPTQNAQSCQLSIIIITRKIHFVNVLITSFYLMLAKKKQKSSKL